MTRILSLAALAAALLSLTACAGSPSTVTNTGASGVAASAVGSDLRALPGGCPANATDPAGQSWHPGDYCIPGGRNS